VRLNQSRFLTEKAQEALDNGQLELAELAALSALPVNINVPDRPVWLPALSVIAEAYSEDRRRAVLHGHTGSVYSAAFSPDGARIVTASHDNTARLWTTWPLLTADTVVYAEIAGLRGLSKDERASLLLTEADIAFGQEHATANADDPGAMCDQLAGDPFDPHKRGPGVPFDNIDAERAIPACRAAVEVAADKPRFGYQHGRALEYYANKPEEAVALYRSAAENGYPAACDYLGDDYKDGSGIEKDDTKALLLYRQAADGRYVPALSEVGRLY
jgi:hypothetical protein